MKMGRLESVAVLAGGIAHDLNNMLTTITGNLYLARLADDEQERDKFLDETERASFQLGDLTRQLLTFSKGSSPVLEIVDLGELLQRSVRFSLRGSRIASEFTLADDLWLVNVDTGQINQAINNLIINAQQAMSGAGTHRNFRTEYPGRFGLEFAPGIRPLCPGIHC